MIKRIDDMPAGTIGFRANGKLTRDDYRNVLEPVLRGEVIGAIAVGAELFRADHRVLLR